jgi:hypothetical protein
MKNDILVNVTFVILIGGVKELTKQVICWNQIFKN